MAVQNSSLCLPSADLLSVIFAENDVPGDKVIWRDGLESGRTLTKAECYKLTRRIAHGYVSSGLLNPRAKEAGVFIMCSENQLIQFPALLAVLAAGGAVATCPHQSSVKEVLFRIDMLKPKAIICSTKTRPLIEEAQSQSRHPFQIIWQDSQAMDVRVADGRSLKSTQEFDWDTTWNAEVADKPSVLVFSSGTTGSPKGVCISQRNIIAMIYQLRILLQGIRKEESDLKMVGVLDSAHVAGMFINTFCALGVGIENVFVPGTEISAILRAIAQHRVQIMFGVPPIYTRMLDDPAFGPETLKSLRYAGTGAAKTSDEVQQRITKAMPPGTYCQQGWGMTELTFLATMPVPGRQGPWASVGKPLAGNRVKIINDQSEEVATSEEGEICVSGPTVTKGYYIAHGQIRASTENGWLRTGDLGFVDENGYLYVVGRCKDLIKYNGAQVSPAELEDVIRQHPAVADVGVVGMELPDGNELPTAFVVLKPEIADSVAIREGIADFVTQQVSPYKRLRGGVYVLTEIPKNVMGKVSYKDLRVQAAQKLEAKRLSSAKL